MTATITPSKIEVDRDSGSPDQPAKSFSKLGLAILGYMVSVTLIITLLPFQFSWPSHWRLLLTGTPLDIVANVLLFAPLGFLYRLGTRHHAEHSTFRILWLGAVISSAIESAQLFEVERYTSVIDIGTNALGAWLGALLSDRLSSRMRDGDALVGKLSLELPLMGLVYLIVPLLWLNALASGADDGHAALSLLIAVFGASILGGLQRHHFGPDRGVLGRKTAALAALWYWGGTFPIIARFPAVLLGGGLLVWALAYHRGTYAPHKVVRERRYEVQVLMAAVPAYAVYLVLLGAGPLLDGVGPWQVGVGFPGVASEWTKLEILRMLEMVAAFTLLGYLIAEYRGRSLHRFVDAAPRLAGWLAAGCLTIEGLRGFHLGHGASMSRAVVLLSAGLYGGWLYYLQRRHVLTLLRANDQAGVLDPAPSRAA